jgi:hypothetical protein
MKSPQNTQKARKKPANDTNEDEYRDRVALLYADTLGTIPRNANSLLFIRVYSRDWREITL